MIRARAGGMLMLVLVILAASCGGLPSTQASAPSPVGLRDSVLMRDEAALYRAALAHSVPGQPGYDVERAIYLLEEFVGRFPSAPEREAASERLALLHEIRALRLQLQTLKDIDLRRRP
jgi:hypothetical protein